jgi:hypothetical protein
VEGLAAAEHLVARPVEQAALEQVGLKARPAVRVAPLRARQALRAVDPAEQADRAAVVHRKARQAAREEPLRAQPARKPAEQAVAAADREAPEDHRDKGSRTRAP